MMRDASGRSIDYRSLTYNSNLRMFSCLTFFSQANFHVTCRFFFLKVKQWAKGNWFCSLFLRWDPCLYGRHMHERLSFSFPSQSPFSTLCCSLGFLWPIPTNTRDPIFWGKLNQPNIQLAPHFSNRSKLSKILLFFVLKKEVQCDNEWI